MYSILFGRTEVWLSPLKVFGALINTSGSVGGVNERDVALSHRTPEHATLFALGLNYADHASELDRRETFRQNPHAIARADLHAALRRAEQDRIAGIEGGEFERDVALSHRTPEHATLFALGLNYADHASELDFKPACIRYCSGAPRSGCRH
jgi:2-keto-4-pentenoate hydratase/2-oxohepta-3-ene-1,7-dioic acid hydratase in catechol pathway